MALVTLETDADGIVTLTLNSPETRNAISDNEMIDALMEALDTAEADRSARVILLTGAGRAFSSGGNIKKMGASGGLSDTLPARTRENYRFGIQRIPERFERLDLPVVCAVNGPAIGAGCDLTLMADVRIAGESAVFAESFVKLGLVPGDGGAFLLSRVVGWAKATEMALTGDPLSAEEALAHGLVSRVVPDADLIDTARDVARRIAANPTHAVRLTKRLMRKAWRLDLAETLEVSSAYQAVVHATADHDEAVAAMLEKRKPVFKGE